MFLKIQSVGKFMSFWKLQVLEKFYVSEISKYWEISKVFLKLPSVRKILCHIDQIPMGEEISKWLENSCLFENYKYWENSMFLKIQSVGKFMSFWKLQV